MANSARAHLGPVRSSSQGRRQDVLRVVPAVAERAPAHRVKMRRHPVSRVIDVVLAGAALVVLAPVMAAAAIAVACSSRGPVLFRQERVGQDGCTFVMLKFRTMRASCDDAPHREYVRRLLEEAPQSTVQGKGLYKLVDDPRVTSVGRWLRTSSIDELPQLINVLRGEMALVGPRPVLPWEATMFSPHHQKRFDVPPGITGLWQVSGRNKLTMAEALDLDVRYVEEQSLRLDLKILACTVPVVLGCQGVR
jgi:lipopolysaccharide/colanic/teichoic acid biosynthesis glycosyltransferase